MLCGPNWLYTSNHLSVVIVPRINEKRESMNTDAIWGCQRSMSGMLFLSPFQNFKNYCWVWRKMIGDENGKCQRKNETQINCSDISYSNYHTDYYDVVSMVYIAILCNPELTTLTASLAAAIKTSSCRRYGTHGTIYLLS